MICDCNHWQEEHDAHGCESPGCDCEKYVHSPESSTPAAIADRGGDPDKWPEYVRTEVARLARRKW